MPGSLKRYAFLSVRDTTGVIDFAKGLVQGGLQIIATANTRELLEQAGIQVEAAEFGSAFPTVLGGGLMSLQPRIMAGILADRDDAGALEECAKNDVPLFEVVAVNFGDYRTNPEAPLKDAHLQVGALSLIRAAASNYMQVLVVTKPADYVSALESIHSGKTQGTALHKQLAREAWRLSAAYDIQVANGFDRSNDSVLPLVLRGEYHRVSLLKYGENPHQEAALYARSCLHEPCVAGARLLSGEALSYNNIVDADVGLNLALEFAAPGAVIVKHAMPISAAIGMSVAESIEKAFDAAWASRIGAAVSCNGVVDRDAAEAMVKPGRKLDLVIACDFMPEAIEVFSKAGPAYEKVRLLKAGSANRPAGTGKLRRVGLHHVSGGVLAQTIDDGVYGAGGFHVVSKRVPTDQEMIDLEFACLVAKHARSHAAVLAQGGATAAVATVQTSRIEAAHIALERAGARSQGAVMASDSTLYKPVMRPSVLTPPWSQPAMNETWLCWLHACGIIATSKSLHYLTLTS